MPITFNIPESEAKRGGSDDIVGRFRSGFQTTAGRPVGLDSFRITTGDRDVAERIGEILGQDDSGVSEWDTRTEEVLQVFTDADSVDVLIDGGGVRTSLVLWSNQGKKIVETDGQFLIEDGRVTSNPWPGAAKPLAEIKEDARNGVGPAPSLQVYFRLADDPDLGKFKYFSGSWTAIDNFADAEARLEELGGTVRARLSLERVEFTNAQGQNVSYVKPQLKILGAA